MIDFSTLQGLSVPEGVVTQISVNGKTVWQKAVTPTGIYDDEFPLEWSQLAVSENTANSVTGDGLALRKVSNCVLTQPMLAGASLTINGIENGETVGTATSTPDICQNTDFGCASMYSNAGIMFASVSTPGEYDGFNFKEAGLYYCWMDTESDTLEEGCDFTFILTLPEAIKIYSGDGFSVYGDWKLPSFPEYDKETYPYVVATRVNMGTYGIYYNMFASTTPRYKQPVVDYLTIIEAQDYVMAEYIDGAETWGEVKTGTSNSIGDVYQSLNEIIWINYDVYDTVKNDDGSITPTDTVVLTASPEAVSLDNKMVIEWTGDTTDLVCDSTATFYKLADTVLKEANFIGGAYATASETVSTITKEMLISADGVVGIDGVILSVSAADISYNGMTFHEPGIYAVAGTNCVNWFAYCIVTLTLPVTATHYLYGREADSVVTYNGVELPDIESVWTDKETYPYAMIARYTDGETELAISTSELILVEYGGGYSYAMKAAGTAKVYALTDGWELMGEFSMAQNEPCSSADPIWSNHNILNTDGTVYLAASDPVKSYPDADVALRENEEFLYYEGVGLPCANLTEADLADYPYHLITHMNAYSYVDGMGQTISEPEQYRLTISSAPFYSDGTGNGFKVADDTAKYKCWFCYGDDFSEWVFGHENTNPYIVFYTFVWANHDVYNADNHDELYKSAGVEPFAVKRIGNLYNGTLLSHIYPTPEEDGHEPLPEYAATDYSYHVLSVCYSSYLAFMEMRMFAKPVVVDGDFISTKNGESVEYLFYETNWSNPSKDYPYDWDFVCYENKSGDITPVNNVWDGNGSMVRWANFDIVDSEGAVCIAASDPIHVYVKE